MHVLRCAAIARLRPRRTVRGYAALWGGTWSAVRLLTRTVRCVGGGYPGVHLLLHAGVPAAEPRKEEDVLGAAGAALPGAVRAGRGSGPGRAPASRDLRMLQRLRRHRTLVGAVARQPLHAKSRSRALEVRTALFLILLLGKLFCWWNHSCIVFSALVSFRSNRAKEIRNK